MDAKDLRTQSALSERTNDVTKYTQSGIATQNNRNKLYQDIRSNSSSKVDTSSVRPCAVIGPDRVVPPAVSTDAYVRKAPHDPWPCPDATYHHLPEYPNKAINYQNLTRNISPRQTFQEDMQRIMVPASYNGIKTNCDNFPQLADRNVILPKNVKMNNSADIKYCDVPYTVNHTSNNLKLRPEMGVSNVNPVLVRPAPHGWPSGGVHPQRAYGAPEMYQFPEYPSCAGPRPVPVSRPHRTVQEEPGHIYSDSYYQESNIRYKPYPNVKERYPQTRYDYSNNYSNPFHPPPPFPPIKYDLSKSIPSHTYPGHPHLKYVSNKMPEPVTDGYHRPINQQGNYNAPFRNQIIHPTYGPLISNFSQSKISPYTSDSSMKPNTSNKLLYDNHSKMYVDYENSPKPFQPSETFYSNESPRLHTMRNQIMLSNYPPVNMQSVSPHVLYKKDQQAKHDYMNHYKNFDLATNINTPISRHLPQFSPSAIAISPTDSSTSNDTAHTHGTSLEDYGYVSQSSTASVRSIDSGVNRVSHDHLGRYYDYRYGPVIRTPFIPKSSANLNSSVDSKDKKGINVRQFLQMWNEGDDENTENSSHKEIVIQTNTDDCIKTSKQTDAVHNQEQLYVLGLVNVPSEELSKYEHIQKISKLPENIKGYNSIELLNQFEEVIESSNINCFKSPVNKELQIPLKGSVPKQAMGMSPRPISPLDVEAKISQSVIHKEVGCNFEIKPCSPKMESVELAAPVQSLLGERMIEKVTNPNSNITKSPISRRMDNVLESCKILKRQDLKSLNENDTISSCKMINTQYSNNNSAKTNYSLQDLESNSGVSFASLPRLDNDIELNFPEVNQQFINANKADSMVATSKDLPTLEMTDQMLLKTPKETMKLEVEITKQMSSSAVIEKECSKLSKYRKMKISDPAIKGDNKDQKSLRTDSVIIKNPENIRKLDEIKASSPINKLLDESQQTPINLTSQSDMKTLSVFEADIKGINQCHVTGGIPIDTAIDFSLNKSDDIINVSTKQRKNSADHFIEKLAKGTKNNEDYCFVQHDVAGIVTDLQENDMDYVADTEFLKCKHSVGQVNNIVSNFNESNEVNPIHEKTSSEKAITDIINFKDENSVPLSTNTGASTNSLNHESLTSSVGAVKIENRISECNFINILTQDSCPLDIEVSDKLIPSGILPRFDGNISPKLSSLSNEKEHTELNNIEKQCSVEPDNDNEINEDKEFRESKEELNQIEVYNGSTKEEINSQYESDNIGNIDDSKNCAESNFILQDTDDFVAEQVPQMLKNNVNCNAIMINHILPNHEIQTDSEKCVTDNLKKDQSETYKQCSTYDVDNTFRNNLGNHSEQLETFDKYKIDSDKDIKENNSSRKLFKKYLFHFSKKVHSPQIQNLIIFTEGTCVSVLKDTFNLESKVNDDRNVKQYDKSKASTENLPSTVSGKDGFHNKVPKFNKEVRDRLLDEESESSIVEEKIPLELTYEVNTDFSVNYERNLNECFDTESSVKVLRQTIQESDHIISDVIKIPIKYDDVICGPSLVTENIESCIEKEELTMNSTDDYNMDVSVENYIDLNVNSEIVTNVDSLPPSSPNANDRFSNKSVIINEDGCGPLLPLLSTKTKDHGNIQENVSTDSMNEIDVEPSLNNVENVNETKTSLRLSIQNNDRDCIIKSITYHEEERGTLILNETYESDKIASVTFTNQFTNSSVDDDKNVKAHSNAEVTVLQPHHLDNNRKLFSNNSTCSDKIICDSILNENFKSGNVTIKSDHLVTDSYINSDKYEKKCSEAEANIVDLKCNAIENINSITDDTLSTNGNGYLKENVPLDSINETKVTSQEDRSLEFGKDDKKVVNILQKIPYINEFYDESGDSDESASINNEFTFNTSAKKICNNSNEDKDSSKETIELLKNYITNPNDLSLDLKNTKTGQETNEQSDGNQHNDYSQLKCENIDTKIIKPKNINLLSTQRSLKRSLSDSALNSINEDNINEGIDNVSFGWPFKRKKANNISKPIEPNFIAQNLCSIIQSNRRNSISSMYNEENVSFCILIDNNCIITEGDEEEKICYADLSEDFLCEIQNNCRDEQNPDDAEDEQISSAENCDYSDSLIMECEQAKSIEDSWVEDVACVETVVSEDIAEDVMVGTLSSPKDINLSDNEESGIFSSNISEHTNKVKYIYGDRMCNDDAQFVETLYNTPQMDVNKKLSIRESQVFGECNRIYDNESLEKILSESVSRGASPHMSPDYTESIHSADAYICDKTPDNKENLNIDNISPIESKEHYVNILNPMGNNKVDHENNNLINIEKTQDDTVHSCESSIDDVFSYKERDDSVDYIKSCSPEVTSTTSEEKNTGILLKITNYKGSIISQINGIKSDNSRPRCKFTENKDYINSISKFSSHRPLITKAAQKYIPPLKESIRDLKVKLNLPQHSLLKLKQLKISKDQPKPHKHYSTSPRIPKKPKPKFEDVLMNIDKVQFKMHKEKNKKGKKSIPKVVIKKTENGSHYASTSCKDTFNPDLTGRKWQPWVFLEKNNFIDKMAIKGKTKAMYSHRKNTYVLAEKFHKYKSVNSTKFVISQPKCSDSSTGQLKYTIRLKHNY